MNPTNTMSESIKKIPTLPLKLSGAPTYLQWIISIEKYLDLIPVGDTDYRVWDLVIGDYKQPAKPREKDNEEAALNAKKEHRAWKDGDTIALLTIQKNCEEHIGTRKHRRQVNCKRCI